MSTAIQGLVAEGGQTGEEGAGRAPAAAGNAVSTSIRNLLATSYGDSSLRDALAYLDGKVDLDGSEVRRQLRSDVENDILAEGARAIKAHANAAQRIGAVGQRLAKVNAIVKEMEQLVDGLSTETAHVNREASELKQQETELASKQMLLEAYEDTFVISEADAEVLRDFSTAPDDKFYAAMERVKKVNSDCQVLLASEESQAAGLEIMSAASDLLDAAYSKLFNSVKQQLRAISGPHMRIGRGLRIMLEQLASRPLQFDEALSGLADTRQRNLYDEFVAALTGESRGSKPLDFYAYDVKRYVGDMLAWVHSAIVGEYEQFAALFDDDSSSHAPGVDLETTNDSQKIVRQLVTKSTGGLIKPLRVRVENLLSSQADLTTVYELSGILTFYHSMFLKHVDETAPIATAVAKLIESATLRFGRCVADKVESVKAQLPAAQDQVSDLQPPEFLLDALAAAKAVLRSYETSIAYSPQSAQINEIINDLVEPYLEFCRRIAADMRLIDSEVFLINCYDAVKAVLALFAFAAGKAAQLGAMVDELVDALVEAQLRGFMAKSGMRDAHADDADSLRAFAPKLDEFLPAATMEAGTELARLSSPRLASSITLRASRRFADVYADLYTETAKLHPNVTLLPRTVQEVSVLLALD